MLISASVFERLWAQTCSVAASSPAAASVGLCAAWPSSATARPIERDAGVLDGRVAEEPPQVVLGQRVGDPGQRGDRADDQQRVATPCRQRTEDVELEPPEPVETGAQRHRERRRAEPWRRAVTGWEAALQRQHADLGRKAREEQGEQQAARCRLESGACAHTASEKLWVCAYSSPKAASSAAPPIFARPPVR